MISFPTLLTIFINKFNGQISAGSFYVKNLLQDITWYKNNIPNTLKYQDYWEKLFSFLDKYYFN